MQNLSEHLEDLSEIRSMMERSSRFISLSGLSGVFAGIYALIGAGIAFIYLDIKPFEAITSATYLKYEVIDFSLFFFTDAAGVLILAVSTAIFFTSRNARRKKQAIWSKMAGRMLLNLFLPLLVGGIFCLALLYHGQVEIIAPATLVFYGLALFNAGKYTLADIRYLGISEIILGLFGIFYVGYGLLLWAIGFGILHIIYGLMMYNKYER